MALATNATTSTAIIYRSGIYSVSTPATGGTIYGITGKCPVLGYIKIFDKATPPTLGTDMPLMILPFLGNIPFDYEFAEGVAISNGIQIVATVHEVPLDTNILPTAMTATFRYTAP